MLLFTAAGPAELQGGGLVLAPEEDMGQCVIRRVSCVVLKQCSPHKEQNNFGVSVRQLESFNPDGTHLVY